jgi:predicted dehydrogenase
VVALALVTPKDIAYDCPYCHYRRRQSQRHPNQIGWLSNRAIPTPALINAIPKTHLVAVADIVPAHIDAFNDRFDTIGYTDYRAMLASEQPDIVSICTYVGLHYDMLVAAANAGVKAVFCEKPFVATLAS